MMRKELKRLGRKELVEVIYQLKKNEQQLQEKIDELELQLQDKRIRMEVAGSIADAAMSVTNIFSTAQITADLYLHEIANMKERTQKMLEEAEARCAEMDARYAETYEKWQQLQKELEER